MKLLCPVLGLSPYLALEDLSRLARRRPPQPAELGLVPLAKALAPTRETTGVGR